MGKLYNTQEKLSRDLIKYFEKVTEMTKTQKK